MSDMSGIGLPQRVKLRKPPKITSAYQAQRIRFGILAARHMLERDRLTVGQVDDLEGMECAGWKVRDSIKAYRRETDAQWLREVRETFK